MLLYITADRIGIESGGGVVTKHESLALRELGDCLVLGQEQLQCNGDEPWKWDEKAREIVWREYVHGGKKFELAHFYAGTFGATAKLLRSIGCKICWTIAAHDVAASKAAHVEMGIPFNYPHLVFEPLWQRYISGYQLADTIICPSEVARSTVRRYPCYCPIEIVPHGCELPEKIAKLPERFTVGYMGSFGPDKGVITLLRAWKKLNWKDALLVLAGRDSVSEFAYRLVKEHGGGNITLVGWVNNISDFYNSISCYVQPSWTEGFGIEVLEALAHGRPVLCSDGAGAADLVPEWYRFPAGDAGKLAAKIEQVKIRGGCTDVGYPEWREIAAEHTWDKIRSRYVAAWRKMLG